MDKEKRVTNLNWWYGKTGSLLKIIAEESNKTTFATTPAGGRGASPNRPYSYSQYGTGTSLQWRLMGGIY